MIDPKVRLLRDAHAMVSHVQINAAEAITQSQALAELHNVCDQLWPPAVIVTRYGPKIANP